MDAKPFALLHTKLHQPRLSPDLVPRPHLIEYLNHNPHRPLTLVAAPAGFGKTTLAGEWLSAHAQPVAWLLLDQGDDELRHFLRYVLAALQTIFPEAMADSLSLLQGPELPPLNYLSTIFINELAAAPQPFTLVLDDLHLVQTPSIYQFLEKVIDYLPEQGHLVLISRMDPPLPLARLRARGQMTDIRTGELRFSPAEIAAFLERMGSQENLPAEEIAALAERTEGWAAGVRLASLSLRRPSEMAVSTGTKQYAMSYLMDEVLALQPAHIRAFLLQTSILDRFCGPLCEAVLNGAAAEPGREADKVPISGQESVAYLNRANLFVVSLDDKQRWYRYHHLFQELLCQRLQTEYSATDIAALHRRASRWLAEQDYIEEAIDHALAAGETEQAARLVATFEVVPVGVNGRQPIGANGDSTPSQPPPARGRSQTLFPDNGDSTSSHPPPARGRSQTLFPDNGDSTSSHPPPARGRSQVLPPAGGVGGQAAQESLIEPLTDREFEVLELLHERLSNKEIAQELVISPRTVKKHAANIYQKLGVNKRREAVIKAAEMGLLAKGIPRS